MQSRKTPQQKRARLPRKADFTRQFEKDWKNLSHSGSHDMYRLKQAMLLIVAHDADLPPEWKDHALTGEWDDHRECHIKGDLLLIYRLDEHGVVFVRTGTHSELFGR